MIEELVDIVIRNDINCDNMFTITAITLRHNGCVISTVLQAIDRCRCKVIGPNLVRPV